MTPFIPVTVESDVISKSIRWQEKIFSQSELDQLVRRKQRKIKSSGGPKAVTADMERIFTQRVGNPSSIEARYMSDRLLGSDSKSN